MSRRRRLRNRLRTLVLAARHPRRARELARMAKAFRA